MEKTKTENPSFEKFVVAAVRALRTEQRFGQVLCGVPANVLYTFAREEYSHDEIREGLQLAIQDGTIVLAAKTTSVTKKEDQSSTEYLGWRLITYIDPMIPLSESVWYLGKTGVTLNKDSADHYRHHKIKIYVTADALPRHVRRLTEKKKKSTISARDVINSMLKKGE